MKESNMTNKTCIEDLKTIKDYFIQQSGAAPVCIDYAIEQLEKSIKNNKEA